MNETHATLDIDAPDLFVVVDAPHACCFVFAAHADDPSQLPHQPPDVDQQDGSPRSHI